MSWSYLISLEAKDIWGMQGCMEYLMMLLTCTVRQVWGIRLTQVTLSAHFFDAHMHTNTHTLQTYCDQHLIRLL